MNMIRADGEHRPAFPFRFVQLGTSKDGGYQHQSLVPRSGLSRPAAQVHRSSASIPAHSYNLSDLILLHPAPIGSAPLRPSPVQPDLGCNDGLT